MVRPAHVDRHGSNDSIFGSRRFCPPDAMRANFWRTVSSAFSNAPVNDGDAPLHGDRRGGRHAGQLLGRESEMERIRAFLAAARTNGEALLMTGEPGVG